jgi:hypothetical protein
LSSSGVLSSDNENKVTAVDEDAFPFVSLQVAFVVKIDSDDLVSFD